MFNGGAVFSPLGHNWCLSPWQTLLLTVKAQCDIHVLIRGELLSQASVLSANLNRVNRRNLGDPRPIHMMLEDAQQDVFFPKLFTPCDKDVNRHKTQCSPAAQD